MTTHPEIIGRVVAGKFAIEERVGGGAMGEVFRARHVVLDTPVALKIMRPDLARDPQFKERFYREAKAASRLDHPCSVRVLDFGVEADGLVYIAMEFLDGRHLLDVLRAEWPLPDERVVEILVQALGAVARAHALGIVHRDLKPENIMITVGHEDDGPHYHVKVCDFGIAKISEPRAVPSASPTEGQPALTTNGALIGTPEYMSPEQARGDSLDARSDLYSLGIVLYQLLTGRVPFTGESALGVVLKQVIDEPAPPSKLRPGVNPRLEAICVRAMQKAREARYQSANEMRADLRAAFGTTTRLRDDSGASLPAVAAAPLASDADLGVMPTMRDSGFGTMNVPMSSGHRWVGVVVALVAVLAGFGVALAFIQRGDEAGSQAAASSGASSAKTAPGGAHASSRSDDGARAAPKASAAHDARGTRAAQGPRAASGQAAAAAATAKASGASALPVTPVTTSPIGPPPAPPPPPATSAPPATDYNPAGAFVALGPVTHERVREDAVSKMMRDLSPRLSECYRSALRMVGRPVGGSAQIDMSIDGAGTVQAIVRAPELPELARCAQGVLAGHRMPGSALEDPGGGTASQTLLLRP